MCPRRHYGAASQSLIAMSAKNDSSQHGFALLTFLYLKTGCI